MTSAAEKAKQKADRMRAKQTPAPAPQPDIAPEEPAERQRTDRAPVRNSGARGARKVRRTVDLGPAHHRDLSAWCDRTADELDVTRITGQDVLSALVARLLTDPDLSRALVEDLRASQ